MTCWYFLFQILLSTCNGSAESQQILRHCSRLVYERQDIDVQVFSGIVDIVNICCKHQQGPATVDAIFHLKSMFYVILITSKRKVCIARSHDFNLQYQMYIQYTCFMNMIDEHILILCSCCENLCSGETYLSSSLAGVTSAFDTVSVKCHAICATVWHNQGWWTGHCQEFVPECLECKSEPQYTCWGLDAPGICFTIPLGCRNKH